MREWQLNTVVSVYELIRTGKKTIDTRAPDPSNPEKDLSRVVTGDIAAIIPVNDHTFQPTSQGVLRYQIRLARHFLPRENESWEEVIRRMFHTIELAKTFPNYTLEGALALYRTWPSTLRIEKYGIVALELGEQTG